MSPFVHASRWPLYRLAGNRAKTPGALGYAASEVCAPHPHAELDACWTGIRLCSSLFLWRVIEVPKHDGGPRP